MPSAAILAYDGINPEAVEVWRRRAEDSDDPADDASYERALASLKERGRSDPSDFDEEVIEAELDRVRRIREARARAAVEHYRAVVEARRAELEHAESKLAHYESQGDEDA
jgi:FMN phosphatase YigB (HAD superfamily)